MEKRNCNHCVYIRPRKGNMCTINRLHINNVNTYCCNDFKIDIWVDRMEKQQEGDKKDDDGSKRPYWLLNYSPFNYTFI